MAAMNSIGYWDGDWSKPVRSTCALVVHYPFLHDQRTSRKERDKYDVKNLKDTLKDFAHFYETSASKLEVFELLGNEDKFSKTFQLHEEEKPELFIVFILTHGYKSAMVTDLNEFFTSREVYNHLNRNSLLSDALKLLFISACRGNIIDEEVFKACNVPVYETPGRMMSRHIDRNNPENLDAVRVSVDPIDKNCITMFECVETTLSFSDFRTKLVKAFCETFRKVQMDMGIEEFLTRCMCQQRYKKLRFLMYGSTPELRILKHRPLTITKKLYIRREARPLMELALQYLGRGLKPIEFTYNWKSDDNIPLLLRRAHFYVMPRFRDSREIQSLRENLEENYGFETEHHYSFAELKLSVSEGRENLEGCVLVCIIAPIFEQDGELCVNIDGEITTIKKIHHCAIGPTTEKWVGKPKIFVFLHAVQSNPYVQGIRKVLTYVKTEFSRADTIHAGLLTVILPQRDSVQMFKETLQEFSNPGKIDKASFQQFFFELVRRGKSENSIPPMAISTLDKELRMDFPANFFIENLTLVTGEKSQAISLNELVQRLCSAHGNDLSTLPCPHQVEDDEYVIINPEFSVIVLSADAGSGKSELAKVLARRAKREQKNVTLVDLRKDPENLDLFDWTKGYRDLVEKFSRNRGESRKFGENELLILDGYESVEAEYQQLYLSKMVRDMVSDKVTLLITTRPEKKEALRISLERICQVHFLYINKLPRENQIAFLNQKIRRIIYREDIKFYLDMIVEFSAVELVEKISTLEKVADFINMTNGGYINLYELSSHVLKLTFTSSLKRAGIICGRSTYHQEFKELANIHFSCAYDYFFDRQVHQLQKDEIKLKNLSENGIFRIENYRLVALSKTLAVFLFLYKHTIPLLSIPRRFNEEKRLFEIMQSHRKRSDWEDDLFS
ncbi:Hypothetical predicted protein [Cloeon dipterum]|uniref:Caspase family p20 domain-containing protein n=1 Tax=Cloeon dipterum TaxID=197152 RepID=A0A8S1BX19_9INSE|nr:Hypothetical predicted protein [Cloeon dipterum]